MVLGVALAFGDARGVHGPILMEFLDARARPGGP
jgi:hypothetical protein